MDWDVVELINDKDAEILDLKKQNESLQSELDKQIKDNRKLVRALKEYADVNFWYGRDDENGWEIAEETLNEIGEEEC